VDPQHPHGAEGTGYTFAPLQYLPAAEIGAPVQCQMSRPL
jgi:hypothetical protein